MGKHKEALEAYEDFISRFEDSEDNSIIGQVANALINKSITLGQMEKHEKAIEAYEDFISRFEDSENNSIIRQVANALINKSITLGQMEKHEKAIEAYEDFISRFEDSENNSIIRQVANALINKNITLGQMEKHEEAIEAYEDFVSRFEDSEDNSIIRQVANALINKSVILSQRGRHEEEFKIYEEVISRFKNSKDNSILGQVAIAYNVKAWCVYEFKTLSELDQAIDQAKKAVTLRPEYCEAHHTLASLLGMGGQWEEALKESKLFINDKELLENFSEDVISFFIDAAAAGQSASALKTIEGTLTETLMEPLVVALKMVAEITFHAPQEVVEVANDIVKRIKKQTTQEKS
jgi:tetratricopeptide (TPR) repeat protein